MPTPNVIVTFYENLRFSLREKFNIFNTLSGLGADEEGTYLGGTVRVEATGGTFEIVFHFDEGITGATAPIAYNASASAVAAALNATIGSWTVTELGSSHWAIRMHGPLGTQPGFSGVSVDLTGPMVEFPEYDKVEYKVELEEGCGRTRPPPPSIASGGGNGGARPVKRPIRGS